MTDQLRDITGVTRRDLFDLLRGDPWWGRLDEIEFLSRLYNLQELPSEDARYPTAMGDIVQHRIANHDWEDDWIFSDHRFGLSDGDDRVLLRFISETLHPEVVRSQIDVPRLVARYNSLLAPDGYEIAPVGGISGRPLFGWRHLAGGRPPDQRPDDGPPGVWRLDELRVFISHHSSIKASARAVAGALSNSSVHGFVAHEDIQPTAAWQGVIEQALGSMDAMVALITPEFHSSVWTNQEVGWALGSGVPLIPVRLTANPDGFSGSIQAIPGLRRTAPSVAAAVLDVLLAQGLCVPPLARALTKKLAGSPSYQAAKEAMSLIERLRYYPVDLVPALQATLTNHEVQHAHTVPARIEALATACLEKPSGDRN